ncbi:MAG: DUF4105 domain-containing protein [Candidatus Omnitrophica bacterium]|nr:DUF4105 domain-containing protein [Candidatus Omnitrophota bacterium]
MRTFLKIIFSLPLWLVGIVLQAWSAGAIYFCSFPEHKEWQPKLAITYAVFIVLIWLFHRFRLKGLMISMIFYLIVLMWFHAIKPKTEAVYPDDLRMAYAETNGDYVTLHNVRNCDYRTKDDYDVRYETRRYDLSTLETIDVLVNYWGMDAIAHTFLSFGFGNDNYLCVSIEIRPEIGEQYGMLDGLFKQYEIIYIWADERDLVRLRTNYNNEDVYLYRLQNTDLKFRQKLFLNMMNKTTDLRSEPEFYNTLVHSCTNTIFYNINDTGLYKIPVWKQRILTGNVDRRIYDEGFFDAGVPFEELRKNALINDRAKAADKDKDFSRKIRIHLE